MPFVIKYVNTTVAIKHPKKFAQSVHKGNAQFLGNIKYKKYLINAPKPPPKNTNKPPTNLIPS